MCRAGPAPSTLIQCSRHGHSPLCLDVPRPRAPLELTRFQFDVYNRTRLCARSRQRWCIYVLKKSKADGVLKRTVRRLRRPLKRLPYESESLSLALSFVRSFCFLLIQSNSLSNGAKPPHLSCPSSRTVYERKCTVTDAEAHGSYRPTTFKTTLFHPLSLIA